MDRHSERDIYCVFRTAFGCCMHTKACKKKNFGHFQHFFFFLNVKSPKKVLNEQKKLKTAQKSVSTSFWVRAAPVSWSKYTTDIDRQTDRQTEFSRQRGGERVRWV